MPLLFLLRMLFALLSWVVLAAAIYLLWRWADAADLLTTTVARADLDEERERWMLWLGLGLLAFSFLGRPIVLLLISRPGTNGPKKAHNPGTDIESAGGARLFVDESGRPDAPILIFTHGWSLTSSVWGRLRERLSDEFRTIAWDLPGLGKSRQPKGGALSLSGFAEDLRIVLGHAQGRPVILIGHSIGGMTIQTLARERPELFRGPVAGVVLINTTYTTPLRTMILPRLMQALRWPLIEPMLFLTRVLWPLAWLSAWQSYLSGSAHMANRFAFAGPPARADLEHVTLMTTKASPAVSAKGNLAMMRWDAGDGPAKIGVPLLAIGGGADIITKAEASQAIAAQAPSAQAIIVPGANHMGFLEKEDDYVRLIRDFAYQAQQAAASKA